MQNKQTKTKIYNFTTITHERKKASNKVQKQENEMLMWLCLGKNISEF
jgi:hypothetical protein